VSAKHAVRLCDQEQEALLELTHSGNSPARKLLHAHILLKVNTFGDAWTDARTAEALSVGLSTVARVRTQFCQSGLPGALDRKAAPQRPQKRKLDCKAEAQLNDLANSPSPAGCIRWTLRLLAERMVAMKLVDEISVETVRRVLKKMRASG
jgi:hypothetical protein